MKKRKNLTKITDYAAPKNWSDDDYWDNLLYELKPESSSPQDGINVVVTMTKYRGCSDVISEVYYLTDIKLERFLTIQYLYWNGIRVFPGGSIKQIREYADGGEEVIYCGKFGGHNRQFENGNKLIYNAHQQMNADRKKAEEAAKEAAKAERKAKKLARERVEYERLKTKFEKERENEQ